MPEMKDSNPDFQITPETKISKLLEEFPQLEEVLIEMAPEFKKLRNPILRKTIARVASLRQVAGVGGVSLSEMINRLRKEAGIQEMFISDEVLEMASKDCPSWFSSSRIVQSLDARPMLDAGEQPISRVFNECKNLKKGEIFELITPFVPVPLIEEAKRRGYLVWVDREGDDKVKTYLTPKS
jgi:uncharacterized protein (DUF2249 family)